MENLKNSYMIPREFHLGNKFFLDFWKHWAIYILRFITNKGDCLNQSRVPDKPTRSVIVLPIYEPNSHDTVNELSMTTQ